MNPICASLLLSALLLIKAGVGVASTSWYVNGVNGSDSNFSCTSPTSACKTIGRAISRASSGDSVMVAAATYTENISIPSSPDVIGSGASTTIIDGGNAGTVVTVSTAGSVVSIPNVTIHNRRGWYGGGITNLAVLTINNSAAVSGNLAVTRYSGWGGGIAGIAPMADLHPTAEFWGTTLEDRRQ